MPGVDSVYFQAFQFVDAFLRRRQVIRKGTKSRFLDVIEQVAAEQVTISRQDAYRARRVSRDRKHSRVQSIFRETNSLADIEIGLEPFRASKPE